MWCEWLVFIFPDWCLGTQRVTVCVWVLQEDLTTRKHKNPLCVRSMLWCSSCVNAENPFFCFLQVRLQANSELHSMGISGSLPRYPKLMWLLHRNHGKAPLHTWISWVLLKSGTEVCTTCRSLDHSVLFVGKDRNPGVPLFHLICTTLWRVCRVLCLWVCTGGDGFKLQVQRFSWLK